MCVWYYSLECISLLVFALERINLCVAALDIVIKLSFLWFPVLEADFGVKSCSCCGHQSMGVYALYHGLECISVLVCALECV